ncbi:MAG: SRPBCC family protein [Nitrososphaeraceae archaeon]
MKSIETENENVEQHLSHTSEKRNGKILTRESKGTVTIEGEYAMLRYERRLSYPREVVWKIITDPNELSEWMNTNAVIDGRNGGTIDFVNTLSGFHTTGRILAWDPQRVFEHEWHIAPNPSLPNGESESVIRWELVQDSDSNNTLLTLTHSRLTKPTSLNFAPGWHAYLDRLEASLNDEVQPDWVQRFGEVKELYHS